MLSVLWQGTAVFFFGQIECSGAKRICRVIPRKPSESWRIDAGRIVCGGASAGAIISEYLAYQNDYAVLESDDKVSHMSSHPNVVVSLWQPWRTKEIIIPLMDAGEAPVFLYSNAPPKPKFIRLGRLRLSTKRLTNLVLLRWCLVVIAINCHKLTLARHGSIYQLNFSRSILTRPAQVNLSELCALSAQVDLQAFESRTFPAPIVSRDQ